MTKTAMDEIRLVALGVGAGAGSKYLHSLLDCHKQLYGIPGYSLMYFYPHYNEVVRNSKTTNNYTLMTKLLERLPSVYDTRLLPGSETLNQLGENGDRYLAVSKERFVESAMKYLPVQGYFLASSKQVLIALHMAHYELFGVAIYGKYDMPKTILYHIHCGFYMPDLFNDFPNCDLVLTTRRPSINMKRRLKSSFLEANLTKLDTLDYEIIKSTICSKFAYNHFIEFKNCLSRTKGTTIFVSYDDLVNKKRKAISLLLMSLNINPEDSAVLEETFGGQKHTMRFYERQRKESINEIIEKSKRTAQATKYSELDRVYEALESGDNSTLPTIKAYAKEIMAFTDYEYQYISEIFSFKRLRYFMSELIAQRNKKLMEYNEMHGFYRFKWSTPLTFMKLSMRLRRQVNNGRSIGSDNKLKDHIRIAFYIIIYFLSLGASIYSLASRRAYQLRTYIYAYNYKKRSNKSKHQIIRCSI
jgi:hypothetical protein